MNINLNNDTITAIKKIANRLETLRGLVTVNAYGEVDQWAIIRGARYEREVETIAASIGIANPVGKTQATSDIIRLNEMIAEHRGIVASVAFSDIPADEWLVAKRTFLENRIAIYAHTLGIA